MRILLATLVIWDCSVRLLSCAPFFWGGALSGGPEFLERLNLPFIPSVHIISGSYAYQILLRILQITAAVCLLLGWKTRLATFVTWFMTLSLHFSNELVLNGGDYLLRAYLFAGLFLPWGGSLSLDAGQDKRKGLVVAHSGTVFLFAQVCLLYWSAAMLKMDDSWRIDHSAIYRALNLGSFVTPIGESLLPHSQLLELGTMLSLALEWVAPVLLLCGFGRLRAVGIGLLVIFHMGIGMTLTVGLFWVVPIAALLGMLPTEFWKRFPRLERELRPPSRLETAILITVASTLAYLNLAHNPFLELRTPRPAYVITKTLGLHYGWGMFTGLDKQEDRWLEARAVFRDGVERDILWSREPSFDRPSNLSQRYSNQRWRRYLLNLQLEEQRSYRRPFLDFLKQKTEKTTGAEIVHLELNLYRRTIHAHYRDTEPEKELLLQW